MSRLAEDNDKDRAAIGTCALSWMAIATAEATCGSGALKAIGVSMWANPAVPGSALRENQQTVRIDANLCTPDSRMRHRLYRGTTAMVWGVRACIPESAIPSRHHEALCELMNELPTRVSFVNSAPIRISCLNPTLGLQPLVRHR